MNLRISTHALERYAERVKPALSIAVCRQELDVLLSAVPVSPAPPAWKFPAEDEAPFYAVLSDGIAAAINDNGVVATVIVRGGEPDDMKDRRREWKRQQRQRRHANKDRLPQIRKARIEDEAWPRWSA